MTHLHEQYGDENAFMKRFAPENQIALTRDECVVYAGYSPTLGEVVRGYGREFAEIWVSAQLRDAAEMYGGEKPSASQMALGVEAIVAGMGHLKVLELMLFFLKFKSGEYNSSCRLYGTFDMMKVNMALRAFNDDRVRCADKYFRQMEKRRKKEEERRHDEEVAHFRRCFQAAGMKPLEFIRYIKAHNLTPEEAAEQLSRRRQNFD